MHRAIKFCNQLCKVGNLTAKYDRGVAGEIRINIPDRELVSLNAIQKFQIWVIYTKLFE